MRSVTELSRFRTGSRFWIGNVPSLAVLALAVGLAGCGDVGKTADDYLQSAQEHRLGGDLNAAVIDLKNALQKSPDSSAARFMLGEIYLEIADGASAEKEFLRARELGMGERATALPLARAWLLQREGERVLNELPLPASSDPQYVTVLVLHGQALLGQGNLDQAEETFNKALEASSDSLEANIGLARVAMARGDKETAGDLQAKVEQIDAESVDSLSLKADLYFLNEDYDDAGKIYAKLVKRRPESLTFRLAQSWAQIGSGQVDEAGRSLDVILRTLPNNVTANYLRGVVHYEQGKYQEAGNSMGRVLNQVSDYAPALLVAGASDYALKQYEQARNRLTRLVSMAPKFEPALKLLAATQMALGQENAAAATLRPLMVDASQIEDEQTLRLVAAAALQSGDLKSGRNYIEKAVERAPADPNLRTQLGLTKIGLGDTDSGLMDLEEAAKADGEKPGRRELLLGMNQLQAGKFDEAMESAKQLQAALPNDSVGFVLEGLVHDRQGDQDAAKASFSKALEINPAANDAVHYMAQIELRNNRRDAARAIYDDFLKQNPDSATVLVEAAQLEAALGNAPQVEKHLRHLVEVRPESAAARIFLGRYYLTQNRPREAAATLEEVLQDNREDAGLLEVLGRAQLEDGQTDQAVRTFTQWTNVQNNFTMSHYWLARAQTAAGNMDAARVAVDRSLTLQPGNQLAMMLKGDIAARTGDKAALDGVLKALAGNQAVTTTVAYRDLQASAAALDGKVAEAIRVKEELNAEAPNSQRTIEIATLEARSGDRAGATQRLESWTKEHPNDLMARLQLGGLYSSGDDYAGAERVLAALAEQAPQYWPAQNDLAWALYKQDKTKAALQHAEAAAKLAPDNPFVLDTYGTILLAAGDAPKAIVYLERVVQAAPGLTASQVTLAKSYVLANRPDDAKQLLQRLMRDNKTFAEKNEAQALLAKLEGQD